MAERRPAASVEMRRRRHRLFECLSSRQPRLHDGRIDRRLLCVCHRPRKGNILWKTKIGKSDNGGGYPGPRGTPAVDGDSVYAIGPVGDLACLSVKDGSPCWKKNFGVDFKGQSGGWKYSESPLIDGEKVVVTPGGSQATMVALNKKTGNVIWKGVVPGGDIAGYSSIVPAEIGGTKQYIQLMANGLVGFSDKGEMLWRYGTKGDRFGGNTANIPTPIVKGDQVFASAGYGRAAALLTLSSAGGKFDVKEEYWKPELKNKHGGVVLVGDMVYGHHDDSGRPWCAEFKTGTIKWKRNEWSKGSESASLTYADGMLYIRYANGWVSLVEANNTKAYEEVSTFKIPNGNGKCCGAPGCRRRQDVHSREGNRLVLRR